MRGAEGLKKKLGVSIRGICEMTKDDDTPSTRKVRRGVRGGKRGQGHRLQREGRRVRRPDPTAIRTDATEASLTSAAGLVGFAAYVRRLGVDRALRERFGHLKTGMFVVYPMAAQLRLLLDAFVAGEGRVFGIEALASDPLFVHLAGGFVPSIDVLYDDLMRFSEPELAALEDLVAEHGLAQLRGRGLARVHVDIDTTVTEIYGAQEGAKVGPNPRHRGRPSYHPLLARVAEIDAVIGARLRPGDTSFGEADVPTIRVWLERLRAAVGPDCVVVVRVDAAGDCTALFRAFDELGVLFVVKGRQTQDLVGALAAWKAWRTVDVDADERATRQVATAVFGRGEWREHGVSVRVVAVRSRERDTGKQVYLWPELDFSVQVYFTNDWHAHEDELAHTYDARAGIEPLIAELKGGFAIGKYPSASFDANHAAFLLKLLAYNLLRRYVEDDIPELTTWRVAWIRRAVVLRPGRIVRSGRGTTLRTRPLSLHMLC